MFGGDVDAFSRVVLQIVELRRLVDTVTNAFETATPNGLNALQQIPGCRNPIAYRIRFDVARPACNQVRDDVGNLKEERSAAVFANERESLVGEEIHGVIAA